MFFELSKRECSIVASWYMVIIYLDAFMTIVRVTDTIIHWRFFLAYDWLKHITEYSPAETGEYLSGISNDK